MLNERISRSVRNKLHKCFFSSSDIFDGKLRRMKSKLYGSVLYFIIIIFFFNLMPTSNMSC